MGEETAIIVTSLMRWRQVRRDPVGGHSNRSLTQALSAGLTDGELLECFQTSRDTLGHEAFRILVERHGPMVLGLCRSLVRDPHEADDAFQATFLVLVRRAESIRRRDTIGPWLHGVAGRVARRARAAEQFGASDARSRPTNRSPAPIRPIAESPSVEEIVQDEIARLPEAFRALGRPLLPRGTELRPGGAPAGCDRADPPRAASSGSQAARIAVTRSGNRRARARSRPPPSRSVSRSLRFPRRWLNPRFNSRSGGRRWPVCSRERPSSPIRSPDLAQGVIKTMLLQSFKLSGIGVLMAAGVLGTVVVAQQGRSCRRRSRRQRTPASRPLPPPRTCSDDAGRARSFGS